MQDFEGGNITVYTGPKGGKFIMKKNKKNPRFTTTITTIIDINSNINHEFTR